MDDTTTFRLAFHVEAPATAAESLERELMRIDGVHAAQARTLQPARGIDAQSVTTILLLITATTKTGVIATRHLKEIIGNVKEIAAESGITKIYIEIRRKKRDITLLSEDDVSELEQEAAVGDSPAGD